MINPYIYEPPDTVTYKKTLYRLLRYSPNPKQPTKIYIPSVSTSYRKFSPVLLEKATQTNMPYKILIPYTADYISSKSNLNQLTKTFSIIYTYKGSQLISYQLSPTTHTTRKDFT